VTSPEVFGLHDNAEITTAQNEALLLIETILSVQPRTSSSGGKNIEDQIKEINSKLEFINHGKTGGLKNIEAGSEIYLSEMLVFDVNDIEGEEDKNVEEDLYMISDINVNFSLKDYLTEFLENFMRDNGEYMNECLKVLPKKDQEMYKNFNLRK
jgi:hypothetical protein